VYRFVAWLGIAENKFYSWKARYGKANEHNAKIPRDWWLETWEKQAILDFHANHPLEGYRRLTFMMLGADVVAVGPSRVYRVLKEAGLFGDRSSKASRKGFGFEHSPRPHEHWHVDVSYINISGTFYYLCSILDGFSRAIVHDEIRESMIEPDVEMILQKGREIYPEEKPRIITDNGPQFIAKDFNELIKICIFDNVKSFLYYFKKNKKIERRRRSLKEDCIRPGTPLCLDDAIRLVARYVENGNAERLAGAIGYITPEDKLAGREKEIWEQRDAKQAAARERRRGKRQGEKKAG
jgi:transposase InsO family protein